MRIIHNVTTREDIVKALFGCKFVTVEEHDGNTMRGNLNGITLEDGSGYSFMLKLSGWTYQAYVRCPKTEGKTVLESLTEAPPAEKPVENVSGFVVRRLYLDGTCRWLGLQQVDETTGLGGELWWSDRSGDALVMTEHEAAARASAYNGASVAVTVTPKVKL